MNVSQDAGQESERTLPMQGGAPPDAPHTAHARGSLIGGRYRVTALRGQGGMGTVYAAIDAISGKALAVKRLRPEAAPNAFELFKREFHTLRGLRHPNIIEVYDYASDDAGPFYTMELLEGADLGKAAPLGYRTVCSYLRQIAAVLGLLHARRLLHRDITPRNIWIFPDGRLKLIDFGALSSFGVPNEVVGTLPLLAPEWLAHRSAGIEVDQRADLYSLGALGYWLLTGQHAYPMQTSDDLAQTWTRAPLAPSLCVARVEGTSLEPIPSELDALILALLHPETAARPASSEHVIDRIDAIVGTTPAALDRVVNAWLRSLAFVGRSQELQQFSAQLQPDAKSTSLTVAAGPGLGRSRLLEEFSLLATLSGAVSVLVRAKQRERAYALANAVAVGLADRLLADARVAAQDHAAELAQLSPELRRRLGLPAPEGAPPGRQQLQQALTDWLHALGAGRRIVILVDDIERADEESVAWLTSLVRQIGTDRVLLVVSMLDLGNVPPALPLEMFGRAAQRLQLPPLTASEIEELLHSVFGPADYVARVASVLHRVCRGNPAHCVELLEHLVARELVRYADGAWTLPGQLSEESLPRGRSELHTTRYAGLGARARQLAEVLSIHDGALTRYECNALSELSESETTLALDELVLAAVLSESSQGYGFVHQDVREQALLALPASRRTRAHARFAETLLRGGSDPILELCAALHFWHAGDSRRCQRLVARAVRKLLDNFERTAAAVDLLVQLVELFRSAGCGPRVLAAPLSALALASYTVDPRLAERYGVEALTTLEQLLHLDWTRPLSRYIGKKPALYCALATAAARHRVDVRDLLFMLVVGVGALNGVATSSFDHRLGARCVQVLEPFAALDEHHIVGLICRTTRAVASMTACEDHAATLAELRALAAFIASDQPIHFMPEEFRHFLLITSCFPIGIMECMRMNPAALTCADRIESPESVDIVGADQLRALFYSLRGERERAAEYVQRVETRALQTGTAWQIVTLGPIDAHFTSLWTHDALLGKHAAAELERLSRELPALRPIAVRARATYLVLCGRYREAIEIMQQTDAPQHVLGWTLGQSVLARAHNRLGEHERARELCRAALARRSEQDLDFVLMFLHVQLELALAEAALGEQAAARARMERLLQRVRDVGPLALGAIHETYARIALLIGDLELARRHAKLMRRHYVSIDSPTLYELSTQLIEQLANVDRPSEPAPSAADRLAWLGEDVALTTRVEFARSRSETTWKERARRGLHVVLELTDACSAFILAAGERRDLVNVAAEPPPREVLHWAEASADAASESSATFRVDDTQYCMFPIGAAASAVLVLGFHAQSEAIPEQRTLAALARSLRGVLARA